MQIDLFHQWVSSGPNLANCGWDIWSNTDEIVKPMRKILYIHIGHYKTGTTALQVFLNENARRLRRAGVNYPTALQNHHKHSKLAFSIYRAAGVEKLMHGYNDPTPPADVWAKLFETVRTSSSPAVLVSSEEFIRMGSHPKAVKILHDILAPMRDEFDIRIIAYLRAPQAHLRSWYNQLIKMRRPVPDFNLAVGKVMEPVHYDYALALQPWIDIVGPEAVILRAYHPDLREGRRHYQEFLDILGIEMTPAGWVLPDDDSNPRLDEKMLDLVRLTQVIGMDDGAQKWALTRMEKFLEKQMLAGNPNARNQSFEEIEQRSIAGLEYVENLPNSTINAADFAQECLQPEHPLQAKLENILGFLIDDTYRLRTQMRERRIEVNQRLLAIEKALNITPLAKS